LSVFLSVYLEFQKRAKILLDNDTRFKFLNGVVDWAIWQFAGAENFKAVLERFENELTRRALMKKGKWIFFQDEGFG